MLTDDLDRLAAFEPGPFPVLSLYLDTGPDDTGRRHFDAFLRKELRSRMETYPANSTARQSFEQDVEKVHKYIETNLKPDTNGLAVFASSGRNLFEAIQLPVRFENLVVANDRLHLYPLARAEDQFPRYAALLADTNHARLFVFSTGRRIDNVEVEGQKTKQVKVGGWSQARYQRHIENYHLQHVKEVVDVLDRVVRDEQIPHVILAGDEVVVPMLRDQMPKHLSEKIVDILRMDQRTPEHEVLARSLEVLRRKDAETDEAVVQDLIGQYRGGGLATVGAEEVLAALQKGQVDTLVITARPDLIEGAEVIASAPDGAVEHTGSVSAGLAAVDAAAATADDRPADNTPPALRVADELVIRAKQTSANLRFIENPQLLADIGGVGAFLRFRA